MKIFKMLFSKVVLSALIMILQVLLIIAVAVWANEYSCTRLKFGSSL